MGTVELFPVGVDEDFELDFVGINEEDLPLEVGDGKKDVIIGTSELVLKDDTAKDVDVRLNAVALTSSEVRLAIEADPPDVCEDV